jgi:hypothetical protein
MISSMPVLHAENVVAPDLGAGTVCLVSGSKLWSIAMFIGYVQVSEVELLRDKNGQIATRPIPRFEISDSNPADTAKLYARIDICTKSFQTRKDAETFLSKAKIEKEQWIKNVICDPSQLIILPGKK